MSFSANWWEIICLESVLETLPVGIYSVNTIDTSIVQLELIHVKFFNDFILSG